MGSIKTEYESFIVQGGNKDDLYKTFETAIDQYCDYLIFENQIRNSDMTIVNNVVTNIFSNIENKYRTVINPEISNMISRFLYQNTYVDKAIYRWQEQNMNFVSSLINDLKDHYFLESILINEIDSQIYSMFEVRLDIVSKLYLAINIGDATLALDRLSIAGIIVAHGRFTATSIADNVNRMLGQRVFKGINMPLETKTGEIIVKIRNYILSRSISKEIVLLVDMGSLEEIGKEIANLTGLNVGVINNISTKTVLSVGDGIMNGAPIDEILSSAIASANVSTHLIETEHKKKAIGFCFDSGVKSAESVMRIFAASMPKKSDISFVIIDNEDVNSEDTIDSLLKKYELIFIVGTAQMKHNIAPFIDIESIIASEDNSLLYSLLGNILTNDEIKEFDKNLLVNFSLENIVQNITILNPTTLMNYVGDALAKLQRAMKTRFSNKVLVGLYIHISCMVERLVIKSPEITHPDQDRFIDEHSDYIKVFNNSFVDLIKHYNIEIPLAEIMYLYDYIENKFIYENKKVEGGDLFDE